MHSSPDHFSHRRSLRETFCSPCSGDGEFRKILSCECLFVLGLSDDEDVSLRVKEEAEEFGDVLVEDFADTYNNLTLKSLFMLKHFLEGPNRDAYSHIVKVKIKKAFLFIFSEKKLFFDRSTTTLSST